MSSRRKVAVLRFGSLISTALRTSANFSEDNRRYELKAKPFWLNWFFIRTSPGGSMVFPWLEARMTSAVTRTFGSAANDTAEVNRTTAPIARPLPPGFLTARLRADDPDYSSSAADPARLPSRRA